MEFLHIPFFRLHIDNRRKATAVTGWKAGLIEIHTFDRFTVKSRKYSSQVVKLVNRISVYQEQVLVDIPPAHVQAGDTFGPHRHARHQL